MNTQSSEQPVVLTVVSGGLSGLGETELPFAFDLKNLFRNLMNEIDQMTPSDR